MAKAVVVSIKLFWGYMIHFPFQTAAPTPLPYPPPTTLIGALAAAYARMRRLPEAVRIKGRLESTAAVLIRRGMVLDAYAAIRGYVALHQDLSKVIALPYLVQRGRDFWFGAQAFGKAFGPVALRAVYIVSDAAADEVAAYAWGINRIGSKEGIATVTDVAIADLVPLSERIVSTRYYARASLVEPRRNYRLVKMWRITPEAYSGVKRPGEELWEYYYVPSRLGVYGGEMLVRLKETGVAVDVMGEKLVVGKRLLG